MPQKMNDDIYSSIPADYMELPPPKCQQHTNFTYQRFISVPKTPKVLLNRPNKHSDLTITLAGTFEATKLAIFNVV